MGLCLFAPALNDSRHLGPVGWAKRAAPGASGGMTTATGAQTAGTAASLLELGAAMRSWRCRWGGREVPVPGAGGAIAGAGGAGAGAGVAGAGTGGAMRWHAGTPAGGARIGCNGAFLCDSFERTCWARLDARTTAPTVIEVVTNKAASGTNSVHIKVRNGTTQSYISESKTFPAMAMRFGVEHGFLDGAERWSPNLRRGARRRWFRQDGRPPRQHACC